MLRQLFVLSLLAFALAACGGGGGAGEESSSQPQVVSSAGTILINDSTQRISPNYVNGLITHLNTSDGKSHEVSLGEIVKVCFNSNRVGWGDVADDRNIPTSCTAVGADGKFHVFADEYSVPGTFDILSSCDNDTGAWSMWTKAGVKLWLDVVSPNGWQLAGFVPSKLVNGQVQYGRNGYHPPVISFQSRTLTIDFGSSCFSGFSKPLRFNGRSGFEFTFNSGKEGWGSDSTKHGFLEYIKSNIYNDDKFVATIPSLSCGDRGNVSVKRTDRFGVPYPDDNPYAWFAVPPDGLDNPAWQKGTGVDFYNDDTTNEHFIVLKC